MKEMYTSLLLVIKDGKILLSRKKRGFGMGKINGIGGKVEPGETIEEGLLRESFEEASIIPIDYEKRAEIIFDEPFKGEQIKVIMNVFVASCIKGEPIESEEVEPMWFSLDTIPYNKMFEDDIIWLPEIIAGKKFKANFKFDKNFKLFEHSLEFVKAL